MEGRYSFTCGRCHKTIFLPQALRNQLTGPDIGHETLDDGDLEETRRKALENLRLEHDDFHFAQDLAHQERQAPIPALSSHKPNRTTSASRQTGKRRKEKDPEGGIARYFTKKPRT